MKLTLSSVEANPEVVTYPITLAGGHSEVLRPLLPNDVNKLGNFLLGLSEETKRNEILSLLMVIFRQRRSFVRLLISTTN